MNNSSRDNQTKEVAALSTQRQQWPANRAGTSYTPSQLKSPSSAMLRHGELLIETQYAGIRASAHMAIRPIETIPLRAAQGDDDIMSEQKAL
jgi:hypothetical protein